MSEEAVFNVPGMHCDHCVHAVETELRRVPGVERAKADLATRAVTVRGSALDAAALRAAIAEAGYEAE
ncbi:MAG TPA: heavy metal-associated domain-containing protein [Gaiellaceae bacterium]|nr:heavy metal-associated domain-containing protein [Gaiellaceae bacterium]